VTLTVLRMAFIDTLRPSVTWLSETFGVFNRISEASAAAHDAETDSVGSILMQCFTLQYRAQSDNLCDHVQSHNNRCT
jgi:hypothetical protein